MTSKEVEVIYVAQKITLKQHFERNWGDLRTPPKKKLCLFCWYTAVAVEWVRFNSGFLMRTTLLNENQDMMITGAPLFQSQLYPIDYVVYTSVCMWPCSFCGPRFGFGCLFPPPILWEHLSEIESGWELLSDTSPPLCESIWVHYEQLWVNKSLDRRKSHWISLVPFGCNWGHLSNWSISN